MSYLKERIKHAVRFRHKRGYGVHSPFMFNLILYVIRDKAKKYTYPENVEKQKKIGHRENKLLRLISRLIRYLQVNKIACTGKNARLVNDYLLAICPQYSISVDQTNRLREAEFIFIGQDTPDGESIYEWINETSALAFCKKCMVITDIYKNTGNHRLWRQLKTKATVSVDMMWYGILFFDSKLQKGHYNLII